MQAWMKRWPIVFQVSVQFLFLTTTKSGNRFDKINVNNWTVSITKKSVETSLFELPWYLYFNEELLWKFMETDTAAATTRRLLSLWPCLEEGTDTYWAVKLQNYKDFIYLRKSGLSDKEELSSFPLKRQVMATVIIKELGLSILFSLIHCIRKKLLKNRNENPPRKRKWINILMFP